MSKMLRMLFRLAPMMLVAAALAAGATPAGAQAPSPRPSDRAAAREFSFAAYRLRVAVLAQKPQVEAGAARALRALGDSRCDRAVSASPDSRKVDVVLVAALIAVAPVYEPIRAALDRYLAELERVPTADPVLRSGRAGWRSEIDLLHRLPSIPDPCAALEAWQRAGYAPGAAPVNPAAILNPGLAAADDKLGRAGRRMRELGVSAGAARRFTGATLFAGIADEELELSAAAYGARPAP
jgi:hypothetical protein